MIECRHEKMWEELKTQLKGQKEDLIFLGINSYTGAEEFDLAIGMITNTQENMNKIEKEG